MNSYYKKNRISVNDHRIKKIQDHIKKSPQLQQLIDENNEYINKIKTYDFVKLMDKVQPLWTNQNFNSKANDTKLILLLLEYQLRGYSMEYFSNGEGSHIKIDNKLATICTVL